MHELSIAHRIVSIADEAAREAGASRVNRLYLRLGTLSGVVREALEFAYGFATTATLLEGSELVVEPVDVLVRCDSCARDLPPLAPERLRCPECDAPTPQILAGRELEIRAIDYDTASPKPSTAPHVPSPVSSSTNPYSAES